MARKPNTGPLLDLDRLPDEHEAVVTDTPFTNGVARGLFVGTAGVVTVTSVSGTAVAWKCPAGCFIRMACTKAVLSAGAADVVAVF